MMKKIIEIENLKCGGCSTTVSNSLLKIQGVKGVDVMPVMDTVILTYDGTDETLESCMRKLKSLGYPKKGEATAMDTVKSYASCMVGKVSQATTGSSSAQV